VFTVILLSERALPSFERWQTLFEPFVQRGDIAFCEWNQSASARSLSKAVPTLAETIVGKKDWRVAVVDWATGVGEGREAADPENPFDFLDNMPQDPSTGRSTGELSMRDSRHSIVRITHLLLGYPEIGSKAFEPDPSYWDKDEERRVYRSEFLQQAAREGLDPEAASELFKGQLLTKNDVQVHYREVEYTEEERRAHRQISRRYQVQQSRPNEVVLLTTREPIHLNATATLRAAWNSGQDAGPSRFVERNEYPASCRFGVFDIKPRSHSAYETDELEFWLGVLCLTADDLPPSSFQGDRLYRFGVETKDADLGSMLNGHLGELAAAREYFDARIRRPRAPSNKSVAEILQQQSIDVDFDALGGDNLVVSTTGYTLASDVPKSEQARWQASYADLLQKTEIFMRGPRRALSKSVKDTRDQMQEFESENRHGAIEPGPADLEDLRDELAKRSRHLSESATPDILNRDRLLRMLGDRNTGIRRAIEQRMAKGTILAAFAVVLVAWAAGFVPYLVQAGFIGKQEFFQSLGISIAFLAVVALLGLIVLLTMRWILLRRLRAFNKELRRFVLGVKGGANDFAAYLSDIATYMHGRSVLLEAERQQEESERARRRFLSMRQQISDRMDREKGIVARLEGVDTHFNAARGSLRGVDLESDAGFRSVFLWPVGNRRTKLNESGETVAAPYDCVDRLILERVHVKERSPEQSMAFLADQAESRAWRP
jgi:hypothetical protein